VHFMAGLEHVGGSITLDGGTLVVAGDLQLVSGLLLGPDRIDGSVRSQGTATIEIGRISPLTITGNYTQGQNATIQAFIDTQTGTSDVLNVLGTATLAGTLGLTINGVALPGQLFTILTTGNGRIGQFDAIAGWSFLVNPNDVTLRKD